MSARRFPELPFYVVAHFTHPGPLTETVAMHFADRSDACQVARIMRDAGWEVTVRAWRIDQRIIRHGARGKPVWGAGYVEVPL